MPLLQSSAIFGVHAAADRAARFAMRQHAPSAGRYRADLAANAVAYFGLRRARTALQLLD